MSHEPDNIDKKRPVDEYEEEEKAPTSFCAADADGDAHFFADVSGSTANEGDIHHLDFDIDRQISAEIVDQASAIAQSSSSGEASTSVLSLT